MKYIKIYKDIVLSLAKKSTCNRVAVAAVIINEGTLISSGYNGAPRGMKHCGKKHILINNHCKNVVHAELNCLLNCVRTGTSVAGCNMLVTHKPCGDCMKYLIQSGIKKVYYLKPYKDDVQKYFENNPHVKFINIGE